MKRLSLAIAASGLVLAGCTTLGPDYVTPDIQAEEIVTDLSAGNTDLIEYGTVDAKWWERFKDPILTDLLQRAADRNTDLRAALAGIDAAQAVRAATSGQGLPQVGASMAAQRLQSSETAGGFGALPGAPSTQNLFDTALSASWEVDLFGRIARRVEAADADTEAAIEDAKLLALIVQSETALAYAELRSLQNQLKVAKEAEQLARRTLELTELLERSELGAEFDLVRARAEVTETVARQQQLIGAQRATVARIAFLVGERPDALMPALLPEKSFAFDAQPIPIGLSSELLKRRPDVRAAERRLAAATARIGAETADLYPSFSLTGGGGFTSASIDDLIDGSSDVWNIGGFIRWPIFSGGIQRAEIEIAEAGAEIALAEFDGAVLSALSDVEASLSTYIYAVRQKRWLQDARADRQTAYNLANQRYTAGIDDLFSTLDAQRRLTELDAQIAAADAQVLASVIGVYRSLAGGWQTPNADNAMVIAQEAQSIDSVEKEPS